MAVVFHKPQSMVRLHWRILAKERNLPSKLSHVAANGVDWKQQVVLEASRYATVGVK